MPTLRWPEYAGYATARMGPALAGLCRLRSGRFMPIGDTVKTALQRAHKTQIVARLMVEELAFHGVRNGSDVATCLVGYDNTSFPRTSDWSFTRFYVPKAVGSRYRLVDDAPLLWGAFDRLHHKHGLPGDLEIPMESFARAVEIVLKESELRDAVGYRPDPALWNVAIQNCGYIQARKAVCSELMAATA